MTSGGSRVAGADRFAVLNVGVSLVLNPWRATAITPITTITPAPTRKALRLALGSMRGGGNAGPWVSRAGPLVCRSFAREAAARRDPTASASGVGWRGG